MLRGMLATARKVTFEYADEVRIEVYPKTGKNVLHYRDREGDWLNDPTIDTDWTGDRKWKEFDTALEAYESLSGEAGDGR